MANSKQAKPEKKSAKADKANTPEKAKGPAAKTAAKTKAKGQGKDKTKDVESRVAVAKLAEVAKRDKPAKADEGGKAAKVGKAEAGKAAVAKDSPAAEGVKSNVKSKAKGKGAEAKAAKATGKGVKGAEPVAAVKSPETVAAAEPVDVDDLPGAEDRELAPAQAKRLVEQVAAEILAADEASVDAEGHSTGLTELLQLKPGAPVDLSLFDPRATPGVESRARAEAQLAALSDRVSELQERLYAAAAGGASVRRVLLVLQGMDTSGKGGTVRHVVGLLDPNGTRLKAFKAPTPEELEHDFLWRVRANVPEAGQFGIFDRSHYEDVLVAKVRKLAMPMHIGRRYGLINRFEKSLVDDGCVVIKCFLNISPEEQRERLLTRLQDPNKHWKYNPQDVDDRLLWPDFQEAYRIALERCGTEAAPWHVIPADRKWYRNYAVLRLIIEALERIDPQYPAGEFDVAAERARVLAS